jgi:hypothetical protein
VADATPRNSVSSASRAWSKLASHVTAPSKKAEE